jgi:hypothetical protein
MEFDLKDTDDQFTIIGIALLIVVFPVFLFMWTGLAGVQVFSVIVSSLLTLALVLLYFQQSTILDKQTKLMSRDYQSALVLRGPVAKEDEIHVGVKNSGRGKVHQLFLKSEIVSDTGSLELGYGREPMMNVEDNKFELSSESNFQEYAGKVIFRILNEDKYDPDRGFPFKIVAKMLSGEGIDTVHLKLSLEVVDEGVTDGEFSHTIEIADQEISLKLPETRELNGEEMQVDVTTSVEEGIESDYATNQDINKVWFGELGKNQSENDSN